MAIRRRITTTTTDEIYDFPTNFPGQSTEHLLSEPKRGEPTDFHHNTGEDDKSGTRPAQNKSDTKPSIGHTFPDLVVEFKNDFRAMAVILTIIPFIIFVTKIDSIESFKYPLITAALLNLIWFGIPGTETFFKRIKK
jgi:hypothetical protein